MKIIRQKRADRKCKPSGHSLLIRRINLKKELKLKRRIKRIDMTRI